MLSENPDWYAGMNSGELTWSETFGKTIDAYADWVEEGLHPGRRRRHQVRRRRAAVPRRQVGHVPDGQLVRRLGVQGSRSKPEIGVFAAPAVKGTKDPKVGSNLASPYLVMKSTKHADAAMKLVEYLTTDKDAVLTQLKVDSNFRDGYEYETDALGAELQAILAATAAEELRPHR